MKKGKLVKVQIRPGQYVKMYEADAIKQGLIPAESPASGQKMRQRPANKGRQTAGMRPIEETAPSGDETDPDQMEAIPVDSDDEPEDVTFDFETIPGIGPASARALQANGITTLEDLLAAEDLDYLTPQALEAIATWGMTEVEDEEPEDLSG